MCVLKGAKMKIHNQTFNQLVKLNATDIAELISTIGLTALTRRDTKEAKLLFASLLINYGIQIFESENCEVSTSIKNHDWIDSIEYGTGNEEQRN